jgi:hypothetical protein
MQNSATEHHKIITHKTTGSSPPSKVLVCSEHSEAERKFYCQDCQERFCGECILQYHKGHKYIDVKKAVKTHRRVINWLMVRCKVKLPAIAEEAKRVQVMEEMIARNANDTKRSIDEHFQKLSEGLDKKRMELKNGVESLVSEKLKQLTFQKENLSMTMSSLATGIEFTEQAMEEGNERELLLMKNQICDRLEELSEIKIQKCLELSWNFYLHSPYDTKVPFNEVPFISDFRVQSDRVKATLSMVGGEEGVLYNTFTNQRCAFVITLKDNDGTQVMIGGQDVRVSIRVPSPDDLSPLKNEHSEPEFTTDSTTHKCLFEDTDVEDNEDGTHYFKYQPKRQGDYFLQVTINAKPLSGDLMWKVQGSLSFSDLANEMGFTQIHPPYGISPSWHNVVGRRHSWKIKRVFYDEYAVVRVGVMMDFTSDKWGWCNGRREEPDPTPFSLPEYLPSNIPTWNEGEVFVFYSNEDTGMFIIYNETTKQSEVFQRCPCTAARPYVYPSSYTSFSMDPKLEKKLIKMQENEKK